VAQHLDAGRDNIKLLGGLFADPALHLAATADLLLLGDIVDDRGGSGY